MSKEKGKEKVSSNTLLSAISDISKKYGEMTLIDMGNMDKLQIEKVSTGLPSLDTILGGGIPKGRILEVYGPPASGKSTLALLMLAKCQVSGKSVAYIDAENSFDPVYAQKLGVKLDSLLINQPNSGEEALDIVEKLANTGEVGIIVIDSVSNLIPQANLAKEIDGAVNIASTARLLSQTLPRINTAAAKSGTVIVFINQIRMKIGIMYGNPETTSGGEALKFNASVRIEVRGQKAEEIDGKLVTPVKITIKKNKIARPFLMTEVRLISGEGFDFESDLFTVALDKGIIKQGGAWFTYESLKEQGIERLISAIKADETLYANFIEKVCPAVSK